MSRFQFTESLESRTLMSVSTTGVLTTAIQLDRAKIHVDLLKFQSDCFGTESTLLSDILKIKADAGGKIPGLAAPVAQWRKDIHAMRMQLLGDRLAEAQAVYADLSVIAGAKLNLLHDKGTSNETADKAALLTDKIKLQNDMIAGLNARLATRQADYNTIFNDGQAIVTALQSDTNPAVVADVTKYVNDKTDAMTTLTNDLQSLVADRTQLVTDLTALQSG